MTGANGRSFVRMHDGWASDPKMARLLAGGQYEAVVLFWAMVAHAHAHDTDGILSAADVAQVGRSVALPGGNRALRALKRAGLVVSAGRTAVELCAYRRWQTTSDQRESHADRMRTSRARGGPRAPLERERERKNARALHVPQPDADDADGIVRLGPESRAVFEELQRKGNSDG